ncbi:MAG: cytidylate kinase-like family protein [Chloroflexi bacterium]|nr:cytidylate kinase-like family protein [Chloroflexota bacterium]
MTVITFSRQAFSGGDEIAQRVCEQLGYRFFDKEMMVEAAARTGLQESEVVDFSEATYKVQDFISRLLQARPRHVKDILIREEQHGPIATLTAHELNEEDCVSLVCYTVERVHQEGNIVIVGRGGQAILRGRPGVLHVRVFAPLPVRIQRAREQGMTGISHIKAVLHSKDRASAEYLKRFHGIQWADPELYHLLINTGQLDFGTAVEVIVSAARAMEAAPV